MDTKSNHIGATVQLSVPVTHTDLFAHRATADILAVVADNPETGFGIRELGRATDHTHRSISQAVTDLEAVELVTTEQQGPKKIVQINTDRLHKPDDPVLGIPQSEFHEPVRDLVAEVERRLSTPCGIVLFGSVARGEADRRSDIDCFVLVDDTQAANQQTAHDIVSDLHDRQYTGGRYEFHILVESVETARQYTEKLRDIFTDGLTLRESEQLRALKEEVLTDGQ